MMQVNEFPDRTILVDGTEYLYFGGTSYLGVASNHDFQVILNKNIQKWGSFYGSSRNANVQLAIYEEFENYFSDFVKSESSLSVSSGTLAGKLVIEELKKEGNSFFHYPKTHPAIMEPTSKTLFIDGKIHPLILNSEENHLVITVDAMLSGEVLATNFDFIEQVPKEMNVTLVVDESHTLGILGHNGEGVFSSIKTKNIHRKIMISSLGKALGLAGGVIASDRSFIDGLKRSNSFTSSSGASPAYLNAYLESTHIYKNQQEKLKDNLVFIDKYLDKKDNYKFNANYPVIYIDNDAIFTELLGKGIAITSFKYPTYQKRMNRVVITSNHTKEDLKILINILNNDK